ncbi:alpha-mannosidase [Cerasicoccus frondis]|uniref:alpha-mannosidase n=1 Tax=Cerasicoccus frondis TaxID=490090 RepID=UPI0028527FAE|nr:glycoside hydrolase family 38 C-terminal domain-containing protein [Cerasicoccus frondis]
MISSPKTLTKLARIEQNYRSRIFVPLLDLKPQYIETAEHWRNPPPADDLPIAENGLEWGGNGMSAWFLAKWSAEQDYSYPLYIAADTGGCEALFWVNDKPAGIFNHADYKDQRGDHHSLLLCPSAKQGDTFSIAVESYAGHEVAGLHPGDTPDNQAQTIYNRPFIRKFQSIVLLRRDDEIRDLVIDLRLTLSLTNALPDRSFRKGELLAALDEVYTHLWEEPEHVEEAIWRPGVERAQQILTQTLSKRNGDSAPRAGLIGHSHMDTAWLWTVNETIRKCARTYSNALSLMGQYPEYRFIQSSALHAEFMRQHYPTIFAGIQKQAKAGRWEPNGGAWVEPDINLSGGEALIRQFLYGQRFTRKYFDYTADTFWLPDTFGYSASLPQILKGCGIRYFLTTKLSWNDTTSFPYDTFWWKGIDGSSVFAHFNDIHCAPDPGTLINKLSGTGEKDFRKAKNYVQHPDVNQARLISFGKGDGGGGPDYEMLEIARRVRDIAECPRGEYTTVSSFMSRLEQDATRAPTYSGELYFEGHRGVYTQQAAIKRLNRMAEFALRNLDYCSVRAELEDVPVNHERVEQLWKLLLLNHFHDILPGTSLPEVHDQAIDDLKKINEECQAYAHELLACMSEDSENEMSIHNTLNWERQSGWIPAELPAPIGIKVQKVETPWGEHRYIMDQLKLPPLGARILPTSIDTAHLSPNSSSPFSLKDNVLETPYARIQLGEAGNILSWIDHTSGREICDKNHEGLNTFYFGEDIPELWDNWDIDPDLTKKLIPQKEPAKRKVRANGSLQIRLRYERKISERSWLKQDLVFHANSPRIDFETAIHWDDPHRYLGVEFPLAIHTATARHEIQFGHIQRNTHANSEEDRARFEVSQHKWSDFSDANFGVALLNDGKYGLSVNGGRVRLSLMKGGGRPDPRGNRGFHHFTYSLLPHAGGFSVESVVKPAYELNTPLLAHPGASKANASLLHTQYEGAVVETLKPAEERGDVIVRLYDAAGGSSPLDVQCCEKLRYIEDCNFLEEPAAKLTLQPPFGIRSLRFGKKANTPSEQS